jgi:hypothetical protein
MNAGLGFIMLILALLYTNFDYDNLYCGLFHDDVSIYIICRRKEG